MTEVECEECGRSFESNEEYVHHYAAEHFHGEGKSCPFCGEEVEGVEELERHLEEAHNLRIELGHRPDEVLRRCSRCGEMVPFAKFNTHMKEKHPDVFEEITRRRVEGKKRAREARESPEPEELPRREAAEEDIRSVIALEGRDGLNRLKRRRLEEVLSRHPRISPKIRDYILFVWDTNESVRDDLNMLWSTLRDAGVEPAVAKNITDSVFSLEWKYAHILWEHGIEPRYPAMPQPQAWPYYPQPRPPAPPTPYPYYQPEPYHYRPQAPAAPVPPQYYVPPPPQFFPPQPPPKALTREDVEEIVRSVVEEKTRRDRLEMLHEEVEKIKLSLEGLGSMIEEAKAGRQHVEEPIMAKRLEELSRELREMERKLLEQQREYEAKLYNKEIESLEKDLEEMNEKFNELKAALAEQSKLAALQGFQSDAYRFLSQGIEKVAERRPVETIARILYPERFVGPPAPKGPTIAQQYMSELQKRGLVE